MSDGDVPTDQRSSTLPAGVLSGFGDLGQQGIEATGDRLEEKKPRMRWSPAAAQNRARLRWTPWRLLLLPVFFVCWISLSMRLIFVNFEAVYIFAPQAAFFCAPTQFSGLILALVPLFLAIAPAFLIANIALWLIPPARRDLDRAEARVGNSFSKSNAMLAKILPVSVAVLLPIELFAAGSAVCMSPKAIHYRPHSLAALQVYALSQIEAVRPSCSRGSRGSWNARLVVSVREAGAFDLAAQHPYRLSSSPEVSETLRDLPWDYSGIERGCPYYLRKLITVGS